MPNEINPGSIQPLRPGGSGRTGGAKQPAELQGKSFKEIFADQIKAVNELQQMADSKQEDLVTGRTDDIADVLDAVEKADLAFKTLMQVRNKLVDAYEEISRMRI